MENNNKGMGGLIGLIVIVVLVLILVSSSFVQVASGQRGIKTRFGKVVGIVDAGLHFKRPFTDSIHKMNIKTLTVKFETGDDNGALSSASKDLQDVQISTVVTYHIDANKVDQVFQQYNSVDNFQANVIEPAIRETVKTTSAQYTAEELVTKRAEFSDKVNATLKESFEGKSAVLETFSVTNFEFSKSFNEAIEAKVTAQQNAEAAKNKLAQVQYEAEQTVTTAKAVAEAQSIQSAALQSQGGKALVDLEAIKKWDGHLPNQMIPGSTLPFINLTK